MEGLIELINAYPKVSFVFMVLGTLTALMSIIAPFTPTKKDDELLEKIAEKSYLKMVFDFLMRFSVINKK